VNPLRDDASGRKRSVSLATARLLAYDALSDAMAESIPKPNLSNIFSKNKSCDDNKNSNSDSTTSNIPLICGMGITSCIKTSYSPRNGCRTVIHLIYNDVHNPLLMRDKTLVATMHDNHWTRATQERFIAELAYCTMTDDFQNSLSTLQDISIPVETFKSNTFDGRKEGWLLANDYLNIIDPDCLDGVLVLEHTEEFESDCDQTINSMMRQLCDNRNEPILYNSKLRAWVSLPPILKRHLICVPGSFNPVHEGHLKMIKAAYNYLRSDQQIQEYDISALFEISLHRFGKSKDNVSSFANKELAKRLALFENVGLNVIVTKALLFEDKITLLSKKLINSHHSSKATLWFVIGTDTVERITKCVIESPNPEEYIEGLGGTENVDVRFLICPRGDRDVDCVMNKFAKECTAYQKFRERCIVLSNQYFQRIDISSTAIRENREQNQVLTNTAQHEYT